MNLMLAKLVLNIICIIFGGVQRLFEATLGQSKLVNMMFQRTIMNLVCGIWVPILIVRLLSFVGEVKGYCSHQG